MTTVRFTIGHVGGGTKHVVVSPDGVDAELVSLVEELYDADDEHYQGYVIDAADAGMTIFDGGLIAWDTNVGGPECLYYRPESLNEAIEILKAFVHQQQDSFAQRFVPGVPPPRPGLNFLLVGMGEFALHRAAWVGNLQRVRALVEAGHDVNQRTSEGTTPLMGAVWEGHVEMCEFLINHGANVTVLLPSDGWGTDNWSLKQLAHREGHAEVLRLLDWGGEHE